MNNEWKELKIDNLPPDILTGDYVFKSLNTGKIVVNLKDAVDRTGLCNIILFDLCKGYSVVYYKSEQLPPTHEEIMTKWWKTEYNDGYSWDKVDRFIYPYEDDGPYCIHDEFVLKDWFTNRESAQIPPEAL